MKVHIGTHREIGRECIAWARENMPDGFELVDSFEACDIFISVLYDRLLSETEIRSKVRCLNFHPGILPIHRGSGAYSWVIINGERKAGVTLHEIDQSIDHGPIIAIEEWVVKPDDTAESLFRKAEEQILWMFRRHFDSLLHGTYETMPQDESQARLYYRKDLDRAKDLTRFARAFHFTGKEQAYYFNAKGEKIYLKYE